jgi:cellulose synthase/poly-beta-1,6-N-acetylglucosamine synthase-like glycosyltransferase
VIWALYGLTWVFGALYVLIQLRFLALLCLPMSRPAPKPDAITNHPRVAIQIATFRENLALPSLLKAIAQLDWPKEALSVHILDDSPQPEAAETRATVAAFAAVGLPAHYHHRDNRDGFKAGALNLGLTIGTPAEFIAYFDADCRPDPDFLTKTMPHLDEQRVAAVQSMWRYPNATQSPLTMIQAAAFEYLFAYDFPVRARLGLPAYYLGSAAVWRRAVLQDLGGWRHVPFTAEDVDMGLRASNAGWHIAYEPRPLAEDDAVEGLLAFRAQQRRWAQAVLQAGLSAAPDMPRRFGRKTLVRLMDWTSFFPHALIPLTVILVVVLAIWVLLAPPAPGLFWTFSALVLISPATVAIARAQARLHPQTWVRRARLLLFAGPYVAASMTSFLFGFKDLLNAHSLEFVATPKAGQTGVLGGRRQTWLKAHQAPVLLDTAFAVFFLGAGLYALGSGIFSALWPLGLMGANFAICAGYTLRDVRRARP